MIETLFCIAIVTVAIALFISERHKKSDKEYKEHLSKFKAPHTKYHCYIGRWQSPHMGHRWLIDRNLKEGKPVLIMIRDVPTDVNNPFTAWEVLEMLNVAFEKEIRSSTVKLQVIPDIASVNYGRGVGYDVICHEAAAPPEVKRISATEIRRQIRAGERRWKHMVMPGVEKILEEKFRDSGQVVSSSS